MIHLVYLSCLILSQTSPVRIAIMDRLQSQTLASEKYEKDYFLGIELGKRQMAEQGIPLEWKYFELGQEPVSILERVSEVEAWNPDVIIGPRSSNRFLLLKNSFPKRLVISPLATAEAVGALPDNLYSISYPNRFATEALVNFSIQRLKPRGIHAIIESECKNCRDFADVFLSKFKKRRPSMHISEATFATATVESVDVEKLLVGYRKGDLILLPNTSYSSGILASKLSDRLQDENLIFLGNDDWGPWSASNFGRIQSKQDVSGYLVNPWAFESARVLGDVFKKEYAKFMTTTSEPERISLIAFAAMKLIQTVSSEKNLLGLPSDKRAAGFLKAFLEMKAKNPFVFRSERFAILKYTKKGSEFIESVRVPRESIP
jgi:hypothetical protein